MGRGTPASANLTEEPDELKGLTSGFGGGSARRRAGPAIFYRSDLEDQPLRWWSKEEQLPSAIPISSPYPEARCCIKRNTTWVGYCAQPLASFKNSLA